MSSWIPRNRAEGHRKRRWLALYGYLLAASLLGLQLAQLPTANAQGVFPKWTPMASEEFETYRQIFAAYDIQAFRNDIQVLDFTSIKLFRVESADFCVGELCLAIVASACGRTQCPSAAVFAKRDARFDRRIAGAFGGTEFLIFPLSAERDITLMITKRFIAAWRGFGEQ